MKENLTSGALANLISLIDAAGAVGWSLAVMAGLVVLICLYKVIVFWRSGLWQRASLHRVQRFLQAGQLDEAVQCLGSVRHPAGRLVTWAIERAGTGLCTVALEKEMEQFSLRVLDQLKSGLRLVSAVAVLSPLMGLLGTVIGMIDAFRQMELAGSRIDPSLLSGGIWLALLTTAIGLVVAIPATAIHIWLGSVIQKVTRSLEETGTALSSALFLHGGQGDKKSAE